jgi:ATP-dependent RNA helicase DHX29
MDSDFLLVLLRQLMAARPSLRLVLMSATVDSERFSSYLNFCPVLNVPGRTFDVEVTYLPDILSMTYYTLDQESRYAIEPSQLIQVTFLFRILNYQSVKTNFTGT